MTHEKGDSHVYPRAPALGRPPSSSPHTRARARASERGSRGLGAREVFSSLRAWVSDRDDDDEDEDDEDDDDDDRGLSQPFENRRETDDGTSRGRGAGASEKTSVGENVAPRGQGCRGCPTWIRRRWRRCKRTDQEAMKDPESGEKGAGADGADAGYDAKSGGATADASDE